MKHYTKKELELYYNGQMSILSRISCRNHLKSCETCQKLEQKINDDKQLIADLRSSIKLFESLSPVE